MRSQNRVLAVIPARGGSKSIPHKNIAPLAGVPLIGHTIRAAQASRFLQRIVVSTDDQAIADISLSLGAEVPFLRPARLAQDTTPTVEVVLHLLDYLQQAEDYLPDLLVLLQPTSPLRRGEDIDGAIRQFLEFDGDSVVSVTAVDHPPAWMYTMEQGLLQSLLGEDETATRRQDLQPVYRLNGAVYVTTPETVTLYRSFMGPRTAGFVMPAARSVDIDEPLDLAIAEVLMAQAGKDV